MKSLHALLVSLVHDCSRHCATDTRRDILTISRRLENEGFSFFTITLGNYAQDFERSLECGFIASTAFAGFAKDGSIPRFLKGMITQVFGIDGRLLTCPSIACIRSIRQICRFAKKVKLSCSPAREKHALDEYIRLDDSLQSLIIDPERLKSFENHCSVIWSQILWDFNPLDLSPRHGPGATAQGISGNQKYLHEQWHTRLEAFFPADSFLNRLEDCSSVDYLNPEQEPPVRVVTVPKTQKGPRVIGIEPVCMQYTQQAICLYLVRKLETHSYTKGRLNFSDQSINGRLALDSSKSGKFATLDLSEASDRVRLDVVQSMLKHNPLLLDSVLACRSATSIVRGEVTIHLNKFASMGSALCFPIESMVFYSIISQGLLNARRSSNRQDASLRDVLSSIYVYGDDIVVPVDEVAIAIESLTAYGLKVNAAKSFWTGKFRESCGVDAYDGINVTPVYLRTMISDSRLSLHDIPSFVSTSNQLYKAGYIAAATWIEEWVTSKTRIPIPFVQEGASGVGWIRYGVTSSGKRCPKLQRPLVKGPVVKMKCGKDVLDGRPALLKWFLEGLNPRKDHLLTTSSFGRNTVRVQWFSPV